MTKHVVKVDSDIDDANEFIYSVAKKYKGFQGAYFKEDASDFTVYLYFDTEENAMLFMLKGL